MLTDRPATYPGGKNGSGVYQAIINLMPPHRIYVEPFLGNGAIMRLKKPAIESIGIDSDVHVTTAWNGDEVPGLTVLNFDALNYLATAAFPADTLIYCDPPYLMDTRSCKRPLYRHEFTDEQHGQLIRLIKTLPCMVMISGYYSEMYSTNLRGWRTHRFTAQTRGGRTAEEWVWMNFPEPLELHDYRYLGSNFRQRERIKRKQARWRARLQRMPSTERYAMLSVLEELRHPTTPETSPAPAMPPSPPTALLHRKD